MSRMIDFTLLKNNLIAWVRRELPLTVTLEFDRLLVEDDVFNCLVNSEALAVAGIPWVTSHNATLTAIAAALKAALQVETAVLGNADTSGDYMTITLTRRNGYDLEITAGQVTHDDDSTMDVEAVPSRIKAIWSDQNQPAPDGSYLSLLIHNIAKIGTDEAGTPDTDGEAGICGMRAFTLSVVGVGEGSQDTLASLSDSVELASVIDYLVGVNLSPVGMAPVRHIPEDKANQIIEGELLEVAFEVGVPYNTNFVTVTDQVGVIESVELEIDLPPDLRINLITPREGD